MSSPTDVPARALATHGLTLIVFFAASAAPTPLYRLYQQEWLFSATWLTAIFAMYAIALLVALLLVARLSDHLGRRPVIGLAIALEIVSMLVFIVAATPGELLAARALQGVATGLAAATVGAALLDTHRKHGPDVNSITPLLGLATGALGSTALAELAPAPLVTVYAVIVALLLMCAVLTWMTPETAPRRPGVLASLRPRVSVPAGARAALLAVTPINIALWMLGAFYFSLMPTLVAQASHSKSLWLGGSVVALLTLTGAVAVWIALRARALHALLVGAVLLAAGTAAIRWSAIHGSTIGLLAGSVLAGAGFGSAFLGALRTVLPLAGPHERSQLMGVFYIESYLSFSVPAIGLGFVVQRVGLIAAVNLYSAVIIVLTAAAIGWIVVHRRHVVAPG
ncbi:MAG: MFS transporter [Luteibacter sp.]